MNKKTKCNPNSFTGTEPSPCTAYLDNTNPLIKDG